MKVTDCQKLLGNKNNGERCVTKQRAEILYRVRQIKLGKFKLNSLLDLTLAGVRHMYE